MGRPSTLLVLFVTAGPLAAQSEGHHAHHEAVHHDFSDAERWSAMFDDPTRDEWQRPAEVVTLADIEPGMTVADLGAGTGYFLPYLAAAVGPEGRVLALDPEETLVEHMRRRAEEEGLGPVSVRRIPFDAPGLGPGETDRILIVDTWHHIADRESYSALLLEALASDGRVLVVDFTAESPHGPPPSARLSATQVIEELEAGGFRAEIAAEDLPYQYVVVARPGP